MERCLGKVAVVTGAASGIGEATARAWVAEGGRVVVADRDQTRGAAVEASLGGAGRFMACDVRDEQSVADAVGLAVATYGRLDLVHANAGVTGALGSIAEVPLDEVDGTIAIQLRGAYCTMKHAARALIAQGDGGAIVATASIAGVPGGLGPHAYGAAKAGVIALTRSVAVELAPHRIRVNAVAPGWVATAMTLGPIAHDATALAHAVETETGDSRLGRATRAGDVAAAVLFLAVEAEQMTGQTLVVDAGATLGQTESSLIYGAPFSLGLDP